MKIYYSPQYGHDAFMGLGERGILFDTAVLDTMGLLGLLELRLGLTDPSVPSAERNTAYYRAVSTYMKQNPDNVLFKSFSLSGLETAMACLHWRDTLALLGWDSRSPSPSRRLQALAGIEENFSCPGLPERFQRITEALSSDKGVLRGDTILLPCSMDIMHPAVRRLLVLLKEGGAIFGSVPVAEGSGSNLSKVRSLLLSGSRESVTLDEGDDSFKVLHFPSEVEALSYLAYQKEDSYDVWINPDNKAMDNYLRMMGRPTAGSVMGDSIPQTAQLLILGMGLFYRPLNVNTLVQWLYSPVHPLEARLRYPLAETIAAEGGFDNEKCRSLIDDYIDSVEDREKAQEQLSVFLPDLTQENDGVVSKDRLAAFTDALCAWAASYMHVLEEKDSGNLRIEQLGALCTNIQAFRLLLEGTAEDTLSYETVENWSSTLYDSGSYTQYIPQAGSRFIVSGPGRIAGISQRTIWMGFYNDAELRSSVSFLSPSEVRALRLEDFIREETALQQELPLAAFTHTSGQIRFVTVDRRHGSPVEKHPMMIRFEKQIANLDRFIESPAFDEALKEHVQGVDNATHATSYELQKADLIQWPDHISHTSMDLLIQHPLDYTMQNIADIQGSNVPAMADVKRTKGTVAHAVIQMLFTPDEGQRKKATDVLAVLDSAYPEVFDAQVEAHGAILNLPENRLERHQLKSELRTCVDNLLEILQDNGLSVTGCEHRVREHIRLLPGEQDPWVNGFIDMTLEDREGNPVVFDFKWTSSKRYYQGLLQQNISSQLALYQHLLQQEKGREVRRTGYFLMPEGRLYSREDFSGYFCEKVPTEDYGNLIEKLRNSYGYRRGQILSGHIENGDGMPLDVLDYGKDIQEKNLFPLHQGDDGTKDGNIFSNYPLFK